jgi:hypothetical protein
VPTSRPRLSEPLAGGLGWIPFRGPTVESPPTGLVRYSPIVDAIRQDDIERAMRTPPAEKGRQALEMMRQGFRLKLLALRRRHPDASDPELRVMLVAWMLDHGR